MVTNFSFDELSSIEFEELCSAFLRKWDRNEYERFAAGRDGGIDLRCIKRKRRGVQSVTVFQCKRYKRFSDLFSKLKSEELKKVRELKPSRYGLLTTCSLTPMNKDRIKKLFSPFIVDESDIIGREELNDKLSCKAYEPIVERALGLWWQSFCVLQSTLYNRIRGRSRDVVKTYAKKNEHSLWTQGMAHVGSTLCKYHVAVLTGNPGVGKTTAAEVVLLKMMKKGYVPVVIEKTIDEAEDVWDDKRRQIFYFDDFLGKCYYEAVNRSQESGIWRFISRVAQAKNKLLILTSRTTVLRRSVTMSDAYHDSGIENAPYFCNINQLSKLEKAHILYNRMVGSSLSESRIDVLLRDRNYMKVIEHRNFNPRLIEYVLRDSAYDGVVGGDAFLTKLLEFMRNPASVWRLLFAQQINKIELSMVWAVFLADSLDESKMVCLYDDLLECTYLHDGSGSPADYETAVQGLTDSVLVRRIDEKGAVDFILHDPSIGDYLVGACATSVPYAKAALKSLVDIRATKKFLDLMRQQSVGKRTFFDACAFIVQDMSFEDVKAQAVMFRLCSELVDLDVTRGRGVVRDKFRGLSVLDCDDGSVKELVELIYALENGVELAWKLDMGLELTTESIRDLMRRCDDFEACAHLFAVAQRHELCKLEDLGDLLTERLGSYAEMDIMYMIDTPAFEFEDEDTWKIQPSEEARITKELVQRMGDVLDDYDIPAHLVDMGAIVDAIDYRDHFQPDPNDFAEYHTDDYTASASLGARDELMVSSDIDRLFGGFRR